MHVHKHTHTCTHMHTHTHAHDCVSMQHTKLVHNQHVRVHVCESYVCVRVCACVCTHIAFSNSSIYFAKL